MKRAEQLENSSGDYQDGYKVILAKGFGETSTRDIAKQIGITSRRYTTTLATRKSYTWT